MNRTPWALAAVLVAAGGLIHLELWRDGYRAITSVGPLFMANVVASGLVAVALVVLARPVVAVAAAALAGGSLAAMVMSRTTGFLGFREVGWTDPAIEAVAAEVGALVALGLATLVTARARRVSGRRLPLPAAGASRA